MKKTEYILIVFVLSPTVLSGCSSPGLGSKSTKNGAKTIALSISESQVISHILRLLIEYDMHGEIKPTLVNNLGSSTIQHNTLIDGDVSISGVKYNGTDLTGALKEASTKNSKKAMIVTQQGFKKKLDQMPFDSYGFANTYAFMVTKETAKKYHLETASGLAKHSRDSRLGIGSSWMNRKGDGYEGSKKRYGFDFGTARPMQIGLVYDALNSEKLDVALGYPTDDRIVVYGLKVLKDDKQLLSSYATSAAATNELLRQHPELKTTTNKLTGKISTSGMQRSNYEADGKGKEPVVVAEGFLKKHYYFDKQKGGHK